MLYINIIIIGAHQWIKKKEKDRETAQWVKYLVHEYEDLSLDLQSLGWT